MPESGSARVKKWRKNLKEKIVKAMGGKCICCGYSKCKEALDLHHVNPKRKEFSIRDIMANPRSWEEVSKELKKCAMLCKICHTEYHYGLRKLPKKYKKFSL